MNDPLADARKHLTAAANNVPLLSEMLRRAAYGVAALYQSRLRTPAQVAEYVVDMTPEASAFTAAPCVKNSLHPGAIRCKRVPVVARLSYE